MSPRIVVINSVDAIVPKTQEGADIFTDLVGSSKSAKHLIVAGVWHVQDLDEPTPGWEADCSEVKYVIANALIIKNEDTGDVSTLTAYFGFPLDLKCRSFAQKVSVFFMLSRLSAKANLELERHK
ncbi:hypothetical protein PENANT_c057G07862 [Penicillium antarcticum]|uniref:Uncharacterized protein n=1 Tax=Penicillium antarcticum TaxID=416450 RepID=A0A1V6PQH0_9EURO|nr:uncharacterized protein N7508_006832 [Penicillium antarcticum]KAJ5301969.1 hypothetical protein N7508_006832 [Penicillium antarcticum]OQD79224.1 hypothetical protein PENANT_c057G07862 [Penicillium antarcticum]